MKKIFVFIATIAIFAACNTGAEEKAPRGLNEDSVNRILNQKDAEINSLLGTINDVHDGLRRISEAQGRINTLKDGASERVVAEDIRENIAFIQRIMTLNRERIEELQRLLEKSKINATNLALTIESLQKEIAEKDNQIALLTKELEEKKLKIQVQATEISNLDAANASLKEDKANLAEANESKAQTISQQEKDLNKAWYVFGTKKELKEHNILKSGDVLTQNFNHNYFTQIDIREVRKIVLGSKRAQLLTTHPASSYSLVKGADKMYTLYISNPSTFWSVSKYLVVQVR